MLWTWSLRSHLAVSLMLAIYPLSRSAAEGLSRYSVSFEAPLNTVGSPPVVATNSMDVPTLIFSPSPETDGPLISDEVGPTQALEFKWSGSSGSTDVVRLEQIRLAVPPVRVIEVGFDVYVSAFITNYNQFFDFTLFFDTVTSPSATMWKANSFTFRGDGRFDVNSGGGCETHFNFGSYTPGQWHRIATSINLDTSSWIVSVDHTNIYNGLICGGYVAMTRFSMRDDYGRGIASVYLDNIDVAIGPPRFDRLLITETQAIFVVSDIMPYFATTTLQRADNLVTPQWSNVAEFVTKDPVINIFTDRTDAQGAEQYRLLSK